jgi:hypothetical protein
MLKEIVLAAALSAALALGGCSEDGTDPGTVDGDTDSDSDSDADTETSTDPDDDNDGDGLTNGQEEELGTDPNLIDTDGDGYSDFAEWATGTDPNDSGSNPFGEGYFIFISPYSWEPSPQQAVLVLTSGDATTDLSTLLTDDGTDGEDATALMERVTPNTVGGVEDPLNPGAFCAGGLATADDDDDFVPDRFVDVPPGTTVCFDIVPARNETIPPTGAMAAYGAFLDILGDGDAVLDTRSVFFFVPD